MPLFDMRCLNFAPLVRLKHKAGGGLVADQAGWACLPCRSPSVQGILISIQQ